MLTNIKNKKAAFCTNHAVACLHKVNHRAVQQAHHAMHVVYLTSVTLFAHGPYAYAAGGLLAVTIVALLSGDPAE